MQVYKVKRLLKCKILGVRWKKYTDCVLLIRVDLVADLIVGVVVAALTTQGG